MNASQAIYDELKEKQKYSLPKINNSRKRRASVSTFAPEKEVLQFCVPCKSNESNPREVLLESDANGNRVCTVCGTVADRLASTSHDYSDHMRTTSSARTNTRLNYMRERLSQWRMGEPPIPSGDVAKLRAAFNRGYGQLDPALGVYEFHPFLPKHAVRAVINRAKLASHKYTEKWLTIRKLLGCEPHPMPTQELVMFIDGAFITVDRIWSAHFRSIRCGSRTSLFCYNFLFHMFLLQHSVEAYVEHSPWFPIPESEKMRELVQMWAKICEYAGWTHYEAVCHADGTVTRVQYKGTPFNGVFGRTRTMSQTTINLTPVKNVGL